MDIFKALFPCGSITGAPKIKTMDIIADLETTPRGVYCGAIGFITPTKEAVFNVPIRTVVIDQKSGNAIYGVGGGITWDSTIKGEYHEVIAKANILEENRPDFHLLESFLLNEGRYFLLDEHLIRLKNTAEYFGFPFNQQEVTRKLQLFARSNDSGKLKVRLLLAKNGDIEINGQNISTFETPLEVSLAEEPVDSNHPFLYHKTTHRDVYSHFQAKKPSKVFDVLLWNEAGELTEFTNGNVVLEIDEGLWTPPISSGLLAGTYRERLIQTGRIQEKVLTFADLKKSTKIWFINSVRKWVEVKLIG